MSDEQPPRTDALDAATQRRIELKVALSQVETAAASPAGEPGWRDDLVRELQDLRAAWNQHVCEVEGENGLLAELTELSPRLANQITHVRNEHPLLSHKIDGVITHAKESPDNDAIRTGVVDVLFDVVRHRQKGADLVYEGYNIDIGGG